MDEAFADALADCYDPETGIPVTDMGLVYGLDWSEETKRVTVTMTLTTRACPMGDAIQSIVERRLSLVPGVAGVDVKLVFDPPWTPARITREGRMALGLDDEEVA
jgi:metal-sulfur cluster biosynthetic enzyme